MVSLKKTVSKQVSTWELALTYKGKTYGSITGPVMNIAEKGTDRLVFKVALKPMRFLGAGLVEFKFRLLDKSSQELLKHREKVDVTINEG